MKRNFKASPLSLVVKATLAGALTASAAQVHALSWETDNGWTIDLDTSIGYDAQWRMEDQSNFQLDPAGYLIGKGDMDGVGTAALLGVVTDDGNRNFDEHDMVMNKFSFSTDLDVNYGDGGVFLRARGWYDDVYNDDDLYDAQVDLRSLGAPGVIEVNKRSFQKDGLDEHKSDVELLDAFLYHTFFIGDRSLSLRAGQQVVNWGESLFINGGISFAMSPLDATKANAPGVELKDIFLPLGQVYAEFDITETVSMGAYYQWDWERTRVDAPGSYFSVLDGLGQRSSRDILDSTYLFATGDPANPGPIETVRSDKPDEGQFGIALRYMAEWLNSTEFGLYYLQYNDFITSLQYIPTVPTTPTDPGGTLVNEYKEDIDLIGASFGTVFGDTNVSGEVSFRSGHGVQANGVDYPGFIFTEADILQYQVSAIHIFGENMLMDNLTFTGEVGGNRVTNYDNTADIYALVPGGTAEVNSLNNDTSAWGAVARLSADYFSIANGLDLKINATYRHDINGTSAMLFTFTEDVQQFSLKADFTYAGGHQFGASYVWFLHDAKDRYNDNGIGKVELGHLNGDRDNISVYYKFRF